MMQTVPKQGGNLNFDGNVPGNARYIYSLISRLLFIVVAVL